MPVSDFLEWIYENPEEFFGALLFGTMALLSLMRVILFLLHLFDKKGE